MVWFSVKVRWGGRGGRLCLKGAAAGLIEFVLDKLVCIIVLLE